MSRPAVIRNPIVLLLALLSCGAANATRVETLRLPAPGVADAPMRVDVHLPDGYDPRAAIGYPVLYLNDGQDADEVALAQALDGLREAGTIRPVIAVAIHMPADRMGAYGLSDRNAGDPIVAQTKYGPVGQRAHAYSEWVAHALVPAIDGRFNTRATPDGRAILGWSLGALNAFNLGWQYPELFATVGAFSPSFWLSADRTDADAIQRTRLVQRMVDSSEPRGGLAFFFAVGSEEEADDRDGDGVFDALDDVRDLVTGYGTADDPRAKGLAQLGYGHNLDHATRPTRAPVALYVMDGGRHDQPSWRRMLPVFLAWAYGHQAPPIEATGTVVGWQSVPSAHVPARNVDIWLPPSYGTDPDRRYPVVYMHDGQNLFDPSLSYTGVDWGVDEAMTSLVADGSAREAIVVGIWNTPRRFLEYMPQAPVAARAASGAATMLRPDQLASDAYLRFIVEELKPAIDRDFRTLPGRKDTSIAGSSMGGLVSLYAAAQHPEVFGGVGAVSTHWPAGDGIVIDWLATRLPDPATHRLWFDHGTTTLDAEYGPHQQRMDGILRSAGYVEGENWITRVYEGAGHNEAAWRARVDEVLVFLLGPRSP
ncbi:MAG TPA: alpha/beta hydrolase-fold protein [Xanthomonadaceae bacterium]|nr:alpha/beta hydrolase-fold protein [Xanthomonadaceae bacterium]